MTVETNFATIPGDVSVDVIEAVKKALTKLGWVGRHRQLNWAYYDRVKKGLASFTPRSTRAINARAYPLSRARVHGMSAVYEYPREKTKRVKRELIDAGVSLYGLMKAESRHLHKVLHDDEHIDAVVYGQHHSSSAMLIATDERIIYLDKKPMVTLFDEVSYEVISGIEFDIHMLFATLVLHTPVKNYDIRFANIHCAEKFARHIERQRLDKASAEEEPEGPIPIPPPPVAVRPREPFEDMAGYYWLPNEAEERRKIQDGVI